VTSVSTPALLFRGVDGDNRLPTCDKVSYINWPLKISFSLTTAAANQSVTMGGGQTKNRRDGAGKAAVGGASAMPTLAARTTIAAVRVDAQNRALKEELKRKDAALVSALAGLERKDKDLAKALTQHLTHEEFAHMQDEARRVVAEETRAQAAGELPARWQDPDAFVRAIEAELRTEKNFSMLVAGLYYHLERKDVVAAALASLWPPLALGNDDHRLPAFRANAVPATKAAMDKHWSEREVMLPACKVLQVLP